MMGSIMCLCFIMSVKWMLFKRLYFSCMGVFLLCVAWFFYHNMPHIIHFIYGLGVFAPLLFVAMYCVATFLFLPTLPIVLAAGALFGPLLGTALNVCSATLSAAFAFIISRQVGLHWMSTQKKKRVDAFVEKIESHGWKSVAAFRLMPFVPFNLVNYGFGLTRIRLRSYVIATFIFIIPYKVIMTYSGYIGAANYPKISPHLKQPYSQSQLK